LQYTSIQEFCIFKEFCSEWLASAAAWVLLSSRQQDLQQSRDFVYSISARLPLTAINSAWYNTRAEQ
jgi:hypothetical protein